jgi:hypothetical protein
MPQAHELLLRDPDPFQPLRDLVADPVARRVLERYCERHRSAGTSLEDAVAVVASAVRRGELRTLLLIASRPPVLAAEDRVLRDLCLVAVRGFGGNVSSPEVLERIGLAVFDVCLRRYPKHRPAFVRRAVRAALSVRGTRLEIDVASLVDLLSELG